MTLINPTALWLLFFVPVAIVFFRWRETLYLKRLQTIRSSLGATVSLRSRWLRMSLWGTCCVLLIVALARPVWGTEIEPVETQGVSIMFVLDVSRSMDAEDVFPSRIERAKLSLQELFHQLSGNEMGLILFASNAIVQFPLTTDTFSAADFVKRVSTYSVSEQGTNITDAIRLATITLKSATKGKRLIVLLTDGEAHEGNLASVVKDAAQADISIYTIGYGEFAGALIPIHNPDGSIIDKTDPAGNPVLSALDESVLKSVADAGGGVYVHAMPDGSEVASLMRSINQYVPATLNRGVQIRGIERFDIFLALAVILLTIESLFSAPRRQSA